MRWALVSRGDVFVNALANRHYPRRRAAAVVGGPGAPVVLRTPEGDAFWETGRSLVPDEIKLELADFYGVTVAYLMGWPEKVAA